MFCLGGWFSKYETAGKIVLLPVDSIDPNPMQPRKLFSEQAIAELAASIEANGLLQPITVRRGKEGRFELIAGHRRLLATSSLGRKTIAAVVQEMDDQSSAVLAIVENLQRQDLNCFEEAESIAALIEMWGLNQQQIATKLGKTQPTIANKLRLLRLPPSIRAKICKAGLTERHSRALVRLVDHPGLEEATDTIIEAGYNVEETERFIDSLLTHSEELSPQAKPTRVFIIKDLRLFLNTVNKAVATMEQAGIHVDTTKEEDEEFIQYTIRVPKSAVMRGKNTA